MITYKRIKKKKLETKELAESKKLELKNLVKDGQPEFQNVDNFEEELTSEKIIFTKEEMVEDERVDDTKIIACDHDENGVATEGGSKLFTCEESIEFYDKREV